jgi:hypothetical protein
VLVRSALEGLLSANIALPQPHGQGLDAVEFCRILSGRSTGSGLLNQEVPF